MNQPEAQDAAQRVAFFQQLQQLANKVHATQNIDEIMLDLSGDICDLFGGDRLTIYTVSDDQASLVSKVKTGLASFKQLKLPVSAQSIAGYAGLSRKVLNLLDVYDTAELKSHAPELCFQQGVDKRTGYRTQQMLVAPIVGAPGGELLGVLQLINNRRGGPFPAAIEEGARYLCETLAVAFAQRHKAPRRERWRFASMIAESVLARPHLEAAMQLTASTGVDIEDILLDEFGVKIGVIGRALADFFGAPYMGFHSERRKPVNLLENFNREYVVQNQWLPVEEAKNGLYVLCTDPEQVRQSGNVGRIFPHATPVYCVTTRREFAWMVNQCFGPAEPPAETEADSAAAPYRAPPPAPTLAPEQQEQLLRTVTGMVLGAQQQGLSELKIETMPGKDRSELRFQVTGVIKLG